MGIPHGVMIAKGSKKGYESPMKSPQKQHNSEFSSFEDTFKPMKKPTTKLSQASIVNEVAFDDMPVGGGSQQPPVNQVPKPIHQSSQSLQKQSEAFVDDFNSHNPNQEFNIGEAPHVETISMVQKSDPNILNVDEIQIPSKPQFTFEQLLEKELNEKENNATVLPPDDDRVIRKKPKKEFLKRTSKKTSVPKEDKSSTKYKYYADHFQHKDSKKNTTASGSEHDKSDRSKSNSKSAPKHDNDNKSDDNSSRPDDSNRRTFLSKGTGLGGGKGNKLLEEYQNPINSTPKFNPDDEDEFYENTEDHKSQDDSNKSRRSRKARGPNHSIDNQDDQIDKWDSLDEFEEIERNLGQNGKYQVITRKSNNDGSEKSKKSKAESKIESSPKPDNTKALNTKQVNETGAERQRLAKEKQEFKKQKEKFEADKLAIEKQKRDLDKLKHEFDKNKDIEMKKIHAEKQKIDKERKSMSRQSYKKKEDTTHMDKLYREIDLLKEEHRKKDNKVSFVYLIHLEHEARRWS